MQPIRSVLTVVGAAALSITLVACGSDNAPPALTLQTLSNRADLVSGGQVLVEAKLPANADASMLKVDLGGNDVSSAFVKRADGRVVGLVSGLADGANTLTAKASNNSFSGARLTITNHPIGGPVLLGSQIMPWVCATPTAVPQSGNTPGSNASGLSTNAVDAQCNIATEYKLFYRTTDAGCSSALPDPSPPAAPPANACFKPYTPGSTPADLASTTTLAGVTVPYIVRVERGTIDRGIYDIAVLFDPTADWTANAPQPQWNGKVLYSFGASTGQPRLQFRTEQNWADDAALSRGFMVVDNSMSDSLYNSNRVLNAETVMMMKEHIAENYGEILYTMGNGCSGGSIGQNTAASIYPGLLDGIQVACDFPDSITTGIEVSDCVLLVNTYVKPEWTALMTGKTQTEIDAKKTAISGHLNPQGCQSWNNAFGFNNKPGNYTPVYVINPATGAMGTPAGTPPRNNCGLPAALVYDPLTNPSGPRCGDADASVAVLGTVADGTRATNINDNVGVQYGLKALMNGAITPEEFVTLNEKIGGTDADSDLTAARSVADDSALPIVYQSGIVGSGENFGKLPIIDQRGYDESGIHYIWRSFSERARLDNEAGSHDNQLMWRFSTGLIPPASSGMGLQSLLTMDEWLTSLLTSSPKATMNAERTQAQVVAAKPADAFDYCYLSSDTTFSTKVTDQATCDADPKLVSHSSPHQVAGGPLAENILKCQLKPLNFADYGAVQFTSPQQSRLIATFPDGVCDWSKPGVGQQPPTGPLTFAAGPGGVPLPPAPTSQPL